MNDDNKKWWHKLHPHKIVKIDSSSNDVKQFSDNNNSAAVSTDNTPPTEKAQEDKEDPFDTYSKKPPVYSESDLAKQEEVLKQLGFYRAIEHPDLPFGRFEALINEHNARTNSHITETKNSAVEHINRYTDKVTQAKERKATIENDINYDEAVTNNLPARLAVINKQLAKFFADADKKRSEALKKRTEELQATLKDIISKQRELLNGQQFPFPDYLQKGAQLSKDIISRYEELAKNINTRLVNVHKILEGLDVQGVNPVVLGILNHFGYLCAVIAGWFFYSFYNPATTSDGIFNKLYLGLNTYFHGHSLVWGFGIIICFLLVTSIISALCEWIKWAFIKSHDNKFSSIIKRRQEESKSSSKYTLGAELSEMDTLPLSINITTSSWFEFWMETLPVFFIILIGVLVLSLVPTPATENANSTSSISFITEFIGFLMTTVAGGAFYFYLIVRGKKIAGNNPPNGNWLQRNSDLVRLVLFLCGVDMIALLATFAVGIVQGKANLLQQLIALGQFMVFMNLGGICIGFATYCKGLLNNAGWLEYKLDVTHTKLRYFYHQSIALFFTDDFRKTYKSFFENLMKLMEHRLTAGRKFAAQQANNTGNNDTKTTTSNTREEIWQLSDDDKLYYPELVAEFEGYNKERLELIETINALNKERDTLISQIENWNYRIHLIKENLPFYIKTIQDIGDRERVYLQDGFDLGIWYRQNGMGPNNGYYVTVQPPANGK